MDQDTIQITKIRQGFHRHLAADTTIQVKGTVNFGGLKKHGNRTRGLNGFDEIAFHENLFFSVGDIHS